MFATAEFVFVFGLLFVGFRSNWWEWYLIKQRKWLMFRSPLMTVLDVWDVEDGNSPFHWFAFVIYMFLNMLIVWVIFNMKMKQWFSILRFDLDALIGIISLNEVYVWNEWRVGNYRISLLSLLWFSWDIWILLMSKIFYFFCACLVIILHFLFNFCVQAQWSFW